MTRLQATECYATPDGDSMIDTIHPLTGLTVCFGHTLEQVRSEHPAAQRMTIDEFCERKAERQHKPIEWKETTEERFDEMLGCLPPEYSQHGKNGGFLVGEPFDHDASNGQPRYEAFRYLDGKYLQGSRPMTVAEFKAELAK